MRAWCSKLLFLGALLFYGGSSWAVPDFSQESGIRITSGSPQAITGTLPSIRMYFIRDFRILSAGSTDGVTWSVNTGTRISTGTVPTINFSSITACTILALDAGGFRMLYSVIGSTSSDDFRIHSATSSDGLNWANETSTRIIVNNGQTFVGFPRMIELPNGDWRLYYIQDNNGGNDTADYQVFTSLSTDQGVTWSTGTAVIAQQAGEVGVSVLTDQTVRVFYTAPLTNETTNAQVLSGLSTTSDGNSFNLESGVRLSTTSTTTIVSFPLLFRATDTFRWRLYHGFTSTTSTTTHVYSALTKKPDPTSLSPNTANSSDPALQFTITGEVFSTEPTAMLSKTGETDINSLALTRNSDQQITVSFNVNGATPGMWDLVVTNDDGQTTTLANALTIGVVPGSLSLTDNLFRPLQGQSAQINITLFETGSIDVKIFTLDGKLVRTIFEGTQTTGSTTYTWDGRNTSGKRVASGVYILNVKGPKLDQRKKIVVIK